MKKVIHLESFDSSAEDKIDMAIKFLKIYPHEKDDNIDHVIKLLEDALELIS